MRSTLLFLICLTSSLVSAQRDCQALYSSCIASGRPEVACGCDLATCSGEDPARIREYCASATANLATLTLPYSTPIITGTAGSQPSGQPPITAPAGSIPLGGICSDSRQCAPNGFYPVDCYASNAMLIRRCGNFNSVCTTDGECATNTCVNGLCSGLKASDSSSTPIITGTAGSQPSGQPPITAPAGSIPLGGTCSDDRQCAGQGVQCWASNAMLIRSCGNFNAACTSDAQCAFNTCNNGLCNGFKASTTSASSTPIITGTAGSQPSGQPPITAPAGSIPLGEACSDSRQCAGTNVECFASNFMLIRRCGNFNAACTSDAQCAYNTCNNGLCNGFKPTPSGSVSVSVTETWNGTNPTGITTLPSSSSRASGTGGASGTTTGAPLFTGAAVRVGIEAGVVALAGLLPLVL